MNQTIKSSILASILTLTVIFTAVPVAPVQAQSNSDWRAQLIQLLMQLQNKTTQTTQTTDTSTYSFTRSLKMGDTGEDVRKLQQFLNQYPDTQVSASGIGSKGNETTYYGPATAAAVSKFQNKYKSEILIPAGLTTPTGYFGPSTMKKANALGVVQNNKPTKPTIPNKPTTPATPVDEVEGTILQGDGDLRTFEIDEADDMDIKEAAASAEVAELTLKATDGDLELNRLDIALVADLANTEDDPWDVFEAASLWVDGKRIAERKIDDRKDYQNEDEGTVRFSNLKLILEEDEEVTIIVTLSLQNGIKGAGSNADWDLSVERLRYTNADDFTTDDTNTGDLGEAVTFSIVERGDGEELKFSLSENSPIERSIVVKTDRKTNNKTILEYTVQALDNDIELDQLYVNVETGGANFDDVVSDVRLKINGYNFKRDETISTGSYSNTNVLLRFDINKKITIDEDDKEVIEVVVDFKSQQAYSNGESIIARITAAERDMTEAEGDDDVRDFSGTVVGKVQTLISDGVYAQVGEARFSTDTQGSNDTTGIFTAEFKLTAVEGDFYIKDFASTTASDGTGGVQFSIDTTAGTPASVSASLSSSADERTPGVFMLREGDTETFTLTVVVDAVKAGNHRVAVDSLYFSSNTNGVTGSSEYLLRPVTKFRTPYQYINN